MTSRTIRKLRHNLPLEAEQRGEYLADMAARLRTLGDGDCAYEKALVRYYESVLAAVGYSVNTPPV